MLVGNRLSQSGMCTLCSLTSRDPGFRFLLSAAESLVHVPDLLKPIVEEALGSWGGHIVKGGNACKIGRQVT